MKSNEATEQKALIKWCELQSCKHEELKWIFHCPNEAKRSPRQGAELKRMGMKPGIPDILLLEPKGKFIGLAIEMKWGKNKPTENQKKWLRRLKEVGYQVNVCYSADEGIEVIKKYLSI